MRAWLFIACAGALMLVACRQDPAADVLHQQEQISWYPSARVALELELARFHKVMRRNVQDEVELSQFVGKPLEFKVPSSNGVAYPMTLQWSEITLEPRGRFKKDPRYFDYGLKMRHVEGMIGVKLDVK